IDTTTPGEKDGTVVVTYPDGSTDEVPVKVTVTDPNATTDADNNDPKYDEVTGDAGEEVKIPAPTNPDGTPVPDGSTFESDTPAIVVDPNTGEVTVKIPDGAKPGDVIEGTITITYPDGSTDEVPVKVTVVDTIAPDAPVISDKDGNIVVTPAKDAAELVITYVDENGETQTVVVTKDKDGNWTTDDTVVTVNPETGEVTIPGGAIKANTEISAVNFDESGNESDTSVATVVDAVDPVTPDGKDTTDNGVKETTQIATNEVVKRRQSDASTKYQAKLPETGEESNMGILAGTAILFAVGALGKRKKKED
ncbi:Rib/alpha-like domain-containing protein, partial [Streptococcus hyovaginalis]